MKVRLAVSEAFRPEAERVARALARQDARVELVPPGSDAELELRSAEGLTGVPAAQESVFFALPEPRDALVAVRSATLDEIPEGGRIGLSGPLRGEMLGVHRPDLRAVEVDDADGAAVVGLLERGEIDAWIASVRDTRRTGLADRTGEVFEPTSWATQAGRGALMLLTRNAPERLRELVDDFEDTGSRAAVAAELAMLEVLGASLDTAVGVMARPHGELLRVRALVPSAAGRRLVRAEVSGSQSDPVDAGRRTAAMLLERGAAQLLGARGA